MLTMELVGRRLRLHVGAQEDKVWTDPRDVQNEASFFFRQRHLFSRHSLLSFALFLLRFVVDLLLTSHTLAFLLHILNCFERHSLLCRSFFAIQVQLYSPYLNNYQLVRLHHEVSYAHYTFRSRDCITSSNSKASSPIEIRLLTPLGRRLHRTNRHIPLGFELELSYRYFISRRASTMG